VPYLQLPDGVPLYYEEHGAGAPILLLPGWTITTGFWKRQIEDLSRDHRVLTFDLRGAGASGKTPDGHTLNAYAADLAHFLAEKQLEKVTLIAWAMGVSVSVHYLVAHGTERVSRFVWVDHSPRFFANPDWPFGLSGNFSPQALDSMLHQLRHDRRAATLDLLEIMFPNGLSDSEQDWMYGEMLKTPTDVAITMLAAVAGTDLRPLLPDLKLPVLLVNGTHSAVPFEVGRWLEEHLPDGRRLVLEGAGHAPYWDAPEGFNHGVRQFIELTT
jgi:pimeloyl-ACP methyl ester carboxylesterase